MATAKRCPCCGQYMFSVHEDHHRQNTWVTYVCRNYACRRCHGNCRHREKVVTQTRPFSLTPRSRP